MRITNNPNHNFPLSQTEMSKSSIVQKDTQNPNIIQDKYTPSQNNIEKATYGKPNTKVDEKTVEKLKQESERTYHHLKELVKQLLERQGLTFQDIENMDATVEIDEETRVEALKMISDGGPLSPEAVSDRIVEFAKAISGGDKEKYETLKDAII
ncbi:hypothetical protein [Serpentinicella alkaliphila]|uniref:Uncharacterized protein n=1 Tax=Serpentinicella alkaliphila TaxID=1734049 RepID=A0A4R2TES2_9FIRM|nr:hypothetical protein [Serpentinicella alkaliphila]QUH25925.1 hypothetical protein HZR23_09395 [Serpentinicella alkaliphila]TCQ02030.1 hypothetical protein EDD79_10193 [Serpentinicella alkaliphila]